MMAFLEGPDYPTLADVLERRASDHPEKLAFDVLGEDGANRELTYGALHREALRVAGLLSEAGARGEPVVLVYAPGLDFITAFVGCLYAGAIAVPAYPPNGARGHGLSRLAAVVGDCGARTVLMDGFASERLPEWLDENADLRQLRWMRSDDGASASALDAPVALGPDDLAFVQYTSGSTASPRGAMVTHGNVIHNLQSIRLALGGDPETDHGVFWLPQYHDMGLIGGLLLTCWSGSRSTIFSPVTFVKRPRVWLETLTRTRATVSGGPNFAYDLCVRTVPETELDGLDLSSWRIAFSGSEPVDAETCRRFAEHFGPCGFRADAFQPGYGMAENTLIVTSRPPSTPVASLTLEAAALESGRAHPVAADDRGRVRTVVSCGPPVPGHEVRIVEPESRRELPPLEVGEIWVRGASVARGYWRRSEDSEATFGGRLSNGEGPFLRTGDLGFLHEGELYVTGRRKELLIFHGKKHYPLDIERTVLAADDKIPTCVAVSVEQGSEDRLVLVCQSRSRRELDARREAIALAVAREHGVDVADVVFVGSGQIPRTSSGKIQRRAVAARYAAGEIERLAPREPRAAEPSPPSPTPSSAERDDLVALLTKEVASKAELPPSAIDVRAPFVTYGLSSVDAVRIAGVLEARLGRPLPPTLPFEYPTIESLASFLAAGEELSRGDAALTRTPEASEDIAIVGMACRFPGARNLRELDALLRRGGDAVAPMPAERSADGRPGPAGGYLEEVDRFAAGFFSIDPAEAAAMDPQQRLLLELAWGALEDAGRPPVSLKGTPTGVWVGISSADYALERFGDPHAHPHSHAAQAHSIAANRISYHFDLHGPSVSVDTACSSSLVALHLACEAVRAGDCELALVGGANLLLAPSITEQFARGGYMSPSGRCRAFDAGADGYVRGEGAAVVVLKPLARALADRDRVYGVVRATACNQDGRTNGLTAPSRQAQESLLRRAYARAGVEPRAVQVVEAHGTGTPLGDPIEARALGAVVGAGRREGEACRIGSIKSNIGHLEAGAGIAGLVKTALSLYTRTLYPTCHFERPNPNIDLGALGLEVQTRCEPWPDGVEPLAGVSSFGFGGTNAHAVLAGAPEAPARNREDGADRPLLLPLSSPTPAGLSEQLEAMADLLASGTVSLEDACFTAAVRRTHHARRRALVGRSARDVSQRLREAAARSESPTPSLSRGRIAFVFGGQGGQWVGMGRDLFEAQPIFRAAFERIAAEVEREAGFSLVHALSDPAPYERIDRVQPLLFALGVSLSQLLRAWGIEPDVMIGQSMGEITAATAAGALSLEDGVRAIVRRSALLARIAGSGAMAMVDLPSERASERLRSSGVTVAVHASPTTSVIAGEESAVRDVCAELEREGIGVRRVQVDVASHCALVDPLHEPLLAALAPVQGREGGVALLSSVTAASLPARELGAEYLWRNLRAPVRFAETIDRALAEGVRELVEIGPHPVLGTSMTQCASAAGASDAAVLPTLRRDEPGLDAMLELVATLYERGRDPEWAAIHPSGRVADLPQAALPRSRHWTEPPRRRASGREHAHPLLDAEVSSAAAPDKRVFELTLGASAFPELTHHRVAGSPILSAGALLELVRAAVSEVSGPGALELEEVRFPRMIPIPPTGDRTLQVVVGPEEDAARASFAVYGRTGEEKWVLHARGSYRGFPSIEETRAPLAPLGDSARLVAPSELYASLSAQGLSYGPPCQRLAEIRLADDACEVRLDAHSDLDGSAYVFHPLLLDMCLQSVAPLVDPALHPEAEPEGLALLEGFRSFRLLRRPEGAVRARAARVGEGRFDVELHDERGLVAEASGLVLASSEAGLVRAPALFRKRVAWTATPLPSSGRVSGRWAIVAPRGPFAEALSASVSSESDELLVLHSPETPYDAEALGRDLADRGVAGVVFSPAGEAPSAVTAFVRLVQRVGSTTPLWLVTRGAFGVLDSDTRSPGQAAVLAAARAAWAEGRLDGSAVDLEAARDDAAGDAAFVWREIAGAIDRHRVVARRGEKRYVPRLRHAEEPEASPQLLVDAGSTYVVTGGLSDLGLHAARWLVRRGARHLVLCGRSDADASRAEALDALRALGASVQYRSVDVRDAGAVEALASELESAEDLPPVGGVVHAAGVVELCPFAELTEARVASALEAKALGAEHLARSFPPSPSRFLLLYGSSSAWLGALARGLAPYAAANAYLEALAWDLAQSGARAVAVAWPPWQDIGRVRDAASAGHFAALGVATIAPAEAERVLDALDAPLTLLGAIDRTLYPCRGADAALLGDLEDGPVVSATQATATAPYEAPRDDLEARLAETWQEVLGVERVGRNDSFFALGGSSLKAATLLNRLRQHMTEEISIVALFEAPTVANLAAYLREHHPACAEAIATATTFETPIPRTERADDLLARIDELSPEEIEALLEDRREVDAR